MGTVKLVRYIVQPSENNRCHWGLFRAPVHRWGLFCGSFQGGEVERAWERKYRTEARKLRVPEESKLKSPWFRSFFTPEGEARCQTLIRHLASAVPAPYYSVLRLEVEVPEGKLQEHIVYQDKHQVLVDWDFAEQLVERAARTKLA